MKVYQVIKDGKRGYEIVVDMGHVYYNNRKFPNYWEALALKLKLEQKLVTPYARFTRGAQEWLY